MLKLLFNRYSHNRLGIEICKNMFRIVHCRLKNNSTILKETELFLTHEIDFSINNHPATEQLKEVVNINQWNGITTAVTTASECIFYKVMELPMLKMSEIKETIKWELHHCLPDNYQNDYVIDWYIMNRNYYAKSNGVKVIVGAMKLDIMQCWHRIFKEAGIPLMAINIVPEALKSWLIYYGNKIWPDIEVIPTALIHVGDEQINILVVNNNNLLLARSFQRVGSPDNCMSEANNEFINYLSASNNNLGRIGILDENHYWKDYTSFLKKSLQVPIVNLTANSSIEFNPKFAVAAGLSLKGGNR
ncbi:MAG: hypothetical protein AB1420_00895 [Bacillota bacterium]